MRPDGAASTRFVQVVLFIYLCESPEFWEHWNEGIIFLSEEESVGSSSVAAPVNFGDRY